MSRPSILDEEMPEEFHWGDFFTERQLRDLVSNKSRWIVLVRGAHPKQMGHRFRLILLTLASYVSEDTCTVGVERLARECAMSDRTVRDILALLEAGGWIRRERVSRRAPTVTTLCWPNDWWFIDPESGSYGYRTESGKGTTGPDGAESGSSTSESGNSRSESGSFDPESGSQTAAECFENAPSDAYSNASACPSGCTGGWIWNESLNDGQACTDRECPHRDEVPRAS